MALRLGRVPDPLSGGEDDDLDPAGLFKSSDQAYRQDVLPLSRGEEPEAVQLAGVGAPAAMPKGKPLSFSWDTGVIGANAPAPKTKPNAMSYSWDDVVTTPEPKKAADSGDTSRGFQAALGQTPALLKGAVGFLGAVGEKTLGEGGNFTALKQWGLEGYKKGMDAISARSKDTDELTTAWDKAKGGDLGALVDWAQYGIGYLGGNVLETVGTSILGGMAGSVAAPGAGTVAGAAGGIVAKDAVKGVAKGLIEGMVAKETAKLVEKAGVETATDAIVKRSEERRVGKECS